MRRFLLLGMLSAFLLNACTGAEITVKKKFDTSGTSVALVDLTPHNDELLEAGAGMESALEEALAETMFVISDSDAKYLLKYKIVKYQVGSRAGRVASLGLHEKSRIYLKVKVAMFDDTDEMVGAWEVESWVTGGITGGSETSVFQEAAEEIVNHMRGY